jgi:hypothetical protein
MGGGAFVTAEGTTLLRGVAAFVVPSSGCGDLADGAEPPAPISGSIVCEGSAVGANAFAAEAGGGSLDNRRQKGNRPAIKLVMKPTIITAQTIQAIRAAADRAGGSLSARGSRRTS